MWIAHCTIDINCKKVVTAKYHLLDAGATQFDQVEAKTFKVNTGKTQPQKNYPATKTVNNKIYTFVGWYDNEACTGTPVKFPYKVGSTNLDFYAKYVRSDLKYTVNYYEEGTTTKVAFSKENQPAGTPGTIIKENAISVPGYTLVSNAQQQIVVKEDGKNEINFYYRKNSYKVTYTYSGTVPSGASELPTEKSYKYGEQVTVAEAASAPGYTFSGWSRSEKFTMPAEDVVISGSFTANSDTGYKVEHYKETLDGSYELADTDNNLKATTDTTVTATQKNYEGFTYDSNVEGTIASGTVTGDGNLVLKLYYVRNTYKVTYEYTGTVPVGASSLPAVETYKYGERVRVAEAASAPGYTFSGWNKPVTFTMPAENVVISGSFTANGDTPYKVIHYLQNLDGTTYTERVVENLEGETNTKATANPRTTFKGYTFDANVEGTQRSGIIAGDGSLVLKLYYVRNTYKVTYEYTGTVPVGASSLPAVETYKYGAEVTVAEAASALGYTFSGWSRSENFTMPAENVVITGSFTANSDTGYKVEVYYEHEGKYSTVPSKTETLAGTTDTKATVAAETYLPTSGYVFDQNAGNVLEGTIAGDNSLVLKVYYKQVFKVTYAPGDHGSFKSQTYTVSYGSQTPGFSGDKTANGNYRFTGWDKTIESRVTGDIVYTAQWAANSNGGGGNGGGGGGSSSGGGGGSSSGPRDNGSTPSGGPGATTVTIDPDAVPLANLPNEDGAADLLVIDDEDVPLAALPKTGQSGTNGLVFFLSSMMLAAFVAVTKKREDDK